MKNFLIRLCKLIALITLIPTSFICYSFGIFLVPLGFLADMVWRGITYLFTGRANDCIEDWTIAYLRDGGDWMFGTLPKFILGEDA